MNHIFKGKWRSTPSKQKEVAYHDNKDTIFPGFPPPGYNPTPVNTLCANALDLTAPASDALLKNRKNAWVQLAGHPGSFAPAGPHTIWKKRMTKENNETVAYQSLMNDVVKDIVPRFYREVHYNGDIFIEIEDLLQHFTSPSIMDIKMGSRTFLESEVKNPVVRKDLYEKMVKLNPNEPTEEEHELKAITKLRYMQFREKGSSTSCLGFRIEAIKMSGEHPNTDLKKIKTRDEVKKNMGIFMESSTTVLMTVLHRLRDIRSKFEQSNFFKNHEVIGSSLLILCDKHNHANVWLIDFAKTLLVEGATLTHRDPWQVGNHEDGYLTGLDNLTEIVEEILKETEKLQDTDSAQSSPSPAHREEGHTHSSSSSQKGGDTDPVSSQSEATRQHKSADASDTSHISAPDQT